MMSEQSWHSLTAEQAVKELRTDAERGLSVSEVAARLGQYGHNELVREKKTPPIVLFFNQFKNILVIVLLIAIILSFLIGEILDGAIISVIVLFVAILGFVQEFRAERALEALKKMLSPSITVHRDGEEQEIPTADVVPGDILYLEAGDKVPADARLLEAHAFKCDESSLTGESFSVDKTTEPLAASLAVNDRKNTVFAGTVVTYGRAKALVTSTGMTTEFGRIAKAMMSVKAEKTPLEKRTEEIGRMLSVTSMIICAVVIVFSAIRPFLFPDSGLTFNWRFLVEIVMFGVALAVAAVPEALPAIVTGALAVGMHQMAKRNALIRKMPAVETLGCTTVICSDKTGTLTRGEMTVKRIFCDNRDVEVTGIGYEPRGEFPSADVSAEPFRSFLLAGILCNDADLFEKEGQWRIKGDSTEAALLVTAAKAGWNLPETKLRQPRREEIPFSSERKRMTTLNEGASGGLTAYMKGAAEMVLDRCTSIASASGVRPLTDGDKNLIRKKTEEMAGQALRVLGLARRELPAGSGLDEGSVEHDMVFLGLAGMIDPPRPEVIEAIRTCKEVKIRPVMITGDHKLTATAIAREVGIMRDGDLSLTGEELSKYSDEEFDKMVDKVSVYARVSPMDKLRIVKAWKHRGEVVAMTGDGVNDAPALKHADIGIAMGITGTEVTKEAADMVLMDDNFATIVKAIELGRWIYDNIKKYLTYLLRCNITEVIVIGGVVLVLGPQFLPLLPAAILYINLATDGLPALALGVAPPDPDIMKRPPRDPKESVFTREVKTFIGLALLIEVPFFLFLFFHDLNRIDTARTEIFFAFIIIELVIALNFRSMRYGVFKAPPHKWLIIAIVWEILLVVGLIQIPGIRDSFGIHFPTAGQIGLILGFGALVFVTMEIVKAILRRKPAAV
jgi:Ca2+-transporting ATPase